ncbi:MAG: beta-ketoacyl synthase N-terminal-like domain-containing protein [Bacteroidota bacterium]
MLYIHDFSWVTSAGNSRAAIELGFENGLRFDGFWKGEVSSPSLQEAELQFPKHDRTHHLAWKALQGLETLQNVSFVNVGSSRGATGLWEKHFETFLKSGKTPAVSSPLTTMGQISAFVASQIPGNPSTLEHSMTCSTSLQAVINADRHLASENSSNYAIAGGTEAPLTPFTIAQFESLRILNKRKEGYFGPLHTSHHGIALGEGCGLVLLSRRAAGAKFKITGMGEHFCAGEHLVDLHPDILSKSMQKAMDKSGRTSVDAVMAHATGTKNGDTTELNSIKDVLGDVPVLSNKWAFGHTFGASGVFNLIWACSLLNGWQPQIPDSHKHAHPKTKSPEAIMVNAVGFGGSAISMVVERV